MSIKFTKYDEYLIKERNSSVFIEVSVKARLRKDNEFIGEQEITTVSMVDELNPEDDLLNVNNTDRRMYNELIALLFNSEGEYKEVEEAEKDIFDFVCKYGNIGSSVIETEEVSRFKQSHYEVEILGDKFKIPNGFTFEKDIISFHRRKPSMKYKGVFISNPDCLEYKGDIFSKGTVFSDIDDLKTLVDQYNQPNRNIDINLMNMHLLECNIAEIFDYNEDGELILTAFFDTIIGLAYWQLKNDIATNMNIKQCAYCGKFFTAKNPKAKYCQNRRDWNGNSQCAIAARNKIGNLRRKVRNEAKKGTPLEVLLNEIKDLDNQTIEKEYKKNSL